MMRKHLKTTLDRFNTGVHETSDGSRIKLAAAIRAGSVSFHIILIVNNCLYSVRRKKKGTP